MKKLLTLFLILTAVLYIYIFTYDKKIYYLSISNNSNINFTNELKNYLKEKKILEKSVFQFSNDNNRIIDYINMINYNKKINDITFKNALVKADIITMAFKPDSINTFSSVKASLEFRDDIIRFLKKVREYSKEDIYFLKIISNSEDKLYNLNVDKINMELKEECKKQKITFIDSNNKSEILKIIINQTLKK